MKIKDYKCKCGHDDFFFSDRGNQKAIYCSYCGKLFKMANKDEQNLSMKHSVLDILRSEINLDTRFQVKNYTNADAVIDAVLNVIDSYRI